MTDHEQGREEVNHTPRHLGEMHPGVALIDEAAATPDVRARWELGLARHRNAFAAFLTLADIDTTAPDLLEKFSQFHYATFPDVRTCADSFIEALGWQSTLDHIERNEPDIAGFLTWDYAAIEANIRDLYEIVPYGGQVHLFDR